MRKKQQKEALVELTKVDFEKEFKEELMIQYSQAYNTLHRLPHFQAWLDSEMAIYENSFGESEAFKHGFLECINASNHFKAILDDEVSSILITLATSSKGADLKNAILKAKNLYYRGVFYK